MGTCSPACYVPSLVLLLSNSVVTGFIFLPFSFSPPLGLCVWLIFVHAQLPESPKAGHLHFVTGNLCGNMPISNRGEGTVWLKSN